MHPGSADFPLFYKAIDHLLDLVFGFEPEIFIRFEVTQFK
jgi:hypothetical protein